MSPHAARVVKPTPNRRVRASRRLAAIALLVLFVPTSWAPGAAARDPLVGDFFSYNFHRSVGGGTGEYYEYYDNLYSSGRYELTSVSATELTVHAAYVWSYSSSERRYDHGSENRLANISLPDRTYTSALTDLDDLDDEVASNYTAWFWISPNLRLGDLVQVLDSNYQVTSRQATIWIGGMPKFAIELKAAGTGHRNDAYGVFSYTWTDAYYYDQQTGWFVAERYVEYDSGTWQGKAAGFTWKEDVDVTATSYVLSDDWVTYAIFLGQIAAVFAFLGLLAYLYRWRPRDVRVSGLGHVKVRKLRKRADFLPPPVVFDSAAAGGVGTPRNSAYWMPTTNFTAFLDDFVNKSLICGDRVAVATEGGVSVGLAMYNREAKIGTVFTQDTGVAETLRVFLGAKDFFSEFRHPMPAQAVADFRSVGIAIRESEAYNIFDTYHVLRLDQFPATDFDVSLVSRMQKSDVAEVAQLARRAYKVASKRWARAMIASGDIGYVARLDGKIVGFGFATFANGAGRIHSLTVLPEYRNRGIGRELLRARLNALKALGATYVITEIAQWNLASMQLAVAHGFQEVGKMWVETARRRRVKRTIVRR